MSSEGNGSAVGSAVSWDGNLSRSTQNSEDRPIQITRNTSEEFEGPLSRSLRLIYGLPAFSTTSLTITIALYANDFYGAHGIKLQLICLMIQLFGCEMRTGTR